MGLIYLAQPAELVGTNRYKIGCSGKDDLSRILSYKKNTKYLLISSSDNYSELENILKNEFKKKFKLVAGQEYFEGEQNEIYNCYLKILQIHNKLSEDTDELNMKEDNVEIKEENVEINVKKYKTHSCYFCDYSTQQPTNFLNHIKKRKNVVI